MNEQDDKWNKMFKATAQELSEKVEESSQKRSLEQI